jgi:putative endonuclease
MEASQELGTRGERLAERFLVKRGCKVLARNYRFGHREIDLIVRCGAEVVFVEVKTRAGTGYGHPLAAITAAKRREIERVARHWLQQHGQTGQRYRFDAVGIVVGRGSDPVVSHVPNAWRVGE